jgi:lipopolysaccharide exporter
MVWRRTTRKQLKYVLNRYKRYLQFDVPSNLTSSLSLNVLNYCLLFLFTTADVGFYSVSYRLAALPLALFSNSLSQVFFQKASKSYRKNGLFWNELKFNLYASCGMSLAIFIPLIFVIKPVISFYLGSKWLPAAEMLICLTPMLALRFISVTIAVVPLIVGRPQVLLINNLALLLAIVASFVSAKFHSLSLLNYLLLNSLSNSVIYIGFIWYIVSETRTKYRTTSADLEYNLG